VRRGGTSSTTGAAMVGWRKAHAREGAWRSPFIGGDRTGEREGFAPKQRRRGRGAQAAAARVGDTAGGQRGKDLVQARGMGDTW
jgi:hypothetical protein